jgi:hypothetical protein
MPIGSILSGLGSLRGVAVGAKVQKVMEGKKTVTKPKTVFGKLIGQVTGRSQAYEAQQSLQPVSSFAIRTDTQRGGVPVVPYAYQQPAQQFESQVYNLPSFQSKAVDVAGITSPLIPAGNEMDFKKYIPYIGGILVLFFVLFKRKK